MKPCLPRLAAALLLAAATTSTPAAGQASGHAPAAPDPQAGAVAADEHGNAHGAADAALAPAGPHARAPLHVQLVIAEPAKVISQGNAVVEALAAADPGRFRKEDEHWVDTRGVYTWDDEEEVYWELISADVLTRGRQDFVQFCASCHGLEGDGYGRSAQHLRPPPRSFQQSNFKFTKVPQPKLPSDEALVKLVRHGLDGTPMLPWDVSEERLHDIVQYIKTLSPEDSGWRDPTNEIGAVIYTSPDPWVGREAEAIAAGEKSYHVNRCWSCHPSYMPGPALGVLQGSGEATAYAADLTFPKRKDSSYTVLGQPITILAPDFTWQTMRYGRDTTEVFQTIAAGIGGVAMPTWGRETAEGKGSVPDEEIWAIAHYVRSLVDRYKDKPERAAFIASLRGGK
jgi:mono/diheme cytochrome c family protein